MTFLYAGKASNNDDLYRLLDVTYYFQYEDPAEVANAWCHNTAQEDLDKGLINEADLCKILKNTLDFDAVIELEETLEKYVLMRPLNPEPLHADRPGSKRPRAEELRGPAVLQSIPVGGADL